MEKFNTKEFIMPIYFDRNKKLGNLEGAKRSLMMRKIKLPEDMVNGVPFRRFERYSYRVKFINSINFKKYA